MSQQQVLRHGMTMRSRYVPPRLSVGGWFPRHMFKGLLQMQGKMHNIDGIIEVHDARIPFTGRNTKLSDIGIIKPSLLVFNKVDLIDAAYTAKIKKRFRNSAIDVLFTNCKSSSDSIIKSLVPVMLEKMQAATRFNRSDSESMNLMVVGIPNVGKSSLINVLRNTNLHRPKGAEVAPRPGVTRHVMEKIQVFWRPPVYVRDTPGVLAPRIPGVEAGIRLALVACVQDEIIGIQTMADYLLYWLNSRGRHEYVSVLGLQGPTDDVTKLLVNIAVRRRMTFTRRGGGGPRVYPDLQTAARAFISQWRKGDYGCAFLDDQELF